MVKVTKSGYATLEQSVSIEADIDLTLEIVYSGVNVATETTNKPLGLFPNPASSSVAIVAEASCTISIYNAHGSLLIKEVAKSNVSTLDIKSLSRGLYIVKVNCGSDVKTGKLVIR